MPDYQRGEGRTALPQRGASQANEAVPAPAPGLDMAPEIPVEYGQPEAVESLPSGKDTENVTLLTQPTNPDYKPNIDPGRIPAQVIRNLPLIGVGSKNPSAPIALRALYHILIDAAEKQHGEYD